MTDVIEENREGIESKPQATVNTTSDGHVVGVVLFLGSGELRELGVADADRVRYHIEGGEVQVLPE